MSLIERAKKDIETITSNTSEFGITMDWTAPTGEKATIIGLHTKHHLGIDTDGNAVNTKTAHVAVSEKFFIDAGYPIRNGAGEVDLKNHKVDVKDSTGIVKKYILKQWFPDETIGLITCILNDFE